MIKLGQNDSINRRTEQALEALDQMVEAELYARLDPEILSSGIYAAARAKYYAALDALGIQITAKVGLPYQLRLRSIDNQSTRRSA